MNSLTPQLSIVISWALTQLLLMGALLMGARSTRPDLFFAVTVNAGWRFSDEGRRVLRRFDRQVLLMDALGLALSISSLWIADSIRWAVFLPAIGLVLGMAGGVFAVRQARRRVLPHQVEPSTEREAILAPRNVSLPGGWMGQLGPFLILAVGVLYLLWRWDAIPEKFPVHWGLDGQPNGWATKRYGSVFALPVTGALTCLFLDALMFGLARSVRRVHSTGANAEREVRNLRNALCLILGLNYWMAVMMSLTCLLPLTLGAERSILSSNLVFALSMGGTAVIVFVAYLMAIRSGQGGWKLATAGSAPVDTVTPPIGDRTPDSCWKAGMIYWNPNDPAIFVEKRFGWGWTINMGNPRGWLVMGGIILFGVVVAWVGIAMTRT